MKTDLCILASGNSVRFQGNKLLANYRGKALIDYVFECASQVAFHRVLVVTQYVEIQKKANFYGYQVIFNSEADKGLSHTIQLGVAASDADQIILLVADQPFIQASTLQTMIDRSQGKNIVCCSDGKDIFNPMLFPKKYFSELQKLSQDKGAKSIAKNKTVYKIVVDPKELRDLDTREDFMK